jgi:hypothetical protein
MSNCTSGCKTQDHDSYAECLQSKTVQAIGVYGSKNITLDRTWQKGDQKELESYYSAVKQGIEPRSTRKKDIDKAVSLSNDAGKAFDGTTLTFKP